MADFLNPKLYLDDLVHVFEEAAGKPEGTNLDPVLCRLFADGLTEISAQVDALVAYAAADGLVRTVEPAADRPRTPVERRNLARLSAPLDPAGRVLSFPTAPVRQVAISEGGSAA